MRSPAATPTLYCPAPGQWDEAICSDGTPRAHYQPLIEDLAAAELEALRARAEEALAQEGVVFGGDAAVPFRVDPVPRLLHSDEWRQLEHGLRQRVRALELFVADAYGAQEIVRQGVIAPELLRSAEHHEPVMAEVATPRSWIGVAGLDLVRADGGRFLVLEDNLRTPSGVAYACAARAATLQAHGIGTPRSVRALHRPFAALEAALQGASPMPEPHIVMLSDGPSNSAWWEHATIARSLGIALLTRGDLRSRDGRLWQRRRGEADRAIDVVYRRTDEDRLADAAGRLTSLGELMLEPLRNGNLACVNAFGTGIADDKLAHAHVERMIEFYLGEKPLLGSVTTLELGRPEVLAQAIDRIGELVIKPRTGHGGHGIFIGPHASRADRLRMRELVSSRPHQYVAQEMVALSTHPTVIEGELAARHVDLRPFVFMAEDGPRVFPGGLTRVALGQGDIVVNSSRSGGGKDTWVLG